jgi:hypothetical protein
MEAQHQGRGRINRLAAAAFICAFLGLSIPAIALGFYAADEVDDSQGAERGKGLALWAMAIGLIVLIGEVILIVAVLGS